MAEWKQIRRSLRRPFETGGFRLLGWIIPLLPRRAVTGLAHAAGRVALLLPLREKRIGLQNLDAVFGSDRTLKEKRRILAVSLATFTQTMLDLFWFSRRAEQRIDKYVTFVDNPLRGLFFEDRPVICITAHMGNWEIMGQTIALRGAPMASIAATVKNKAVDRMLIQRRGQTGQTIIPQQGALKTLIARLRKSGKVAFVLDQNTSEQEGGIVVDFLGLPMPVSSAPAMLAYRTGTDIMIGFCLPRPGGRYEIEIRECIHPPPFDKAADAGAVSRALTQQIQNRISAAIRRHPEYWLWSYRHWRREPGKPYPERYPDYR